MRNKDLTVLDRNRNNNDLLARFLQDLGIIERKKADRENLALPILRIFMKNKEGIISYEDIIRSLPKSEDRNFRSNVVKVCRKLTDYGLIERTAYVPDGAKRWERAFKFVSFYNAVELKRQKMENVLKNLKELGEGLDAG